MTLWQIEAIFWITGVSGVTGWLVLMASRYMRFLRADASKRKRDNSIRWHVYFDKAHYDKPE